MKRCLIIGGADIGDYDLINGMLGDEFAVYCDCGLKHLGRIKTGPDLIVGDFDTWKGEVPEAETIRLPSVKDDTDTVFAVKEALSRGYREFLFIGVTGGRMDHTLANIYLLMFLEENGARGIIADDRSVTELVTDTAEIEEGCEFFSLLAIAGDAEGVTISGAKYCTENAVIRSPYQYGVSNEVLPGHVARVSVRKGTLLLIRIMPRET